MTVMSDRGRVPVWRAPSSLFAALGALALLIGYLPVALTPMQSDDVFLLLLYNAEGHSFFGVIQEALTTNLNQGRTDIASAVVSAVQSWLTWNASLSLGVSVQSVETVLGFVWMAAAVATAARLAAVAWPTRAGRSYPVAFFVVAATVAGTVQIHSRWSQDPVVAYPAQGLGTAILGFLYLTSCLLALRDETIGRKHGVRLLLLGLLLVFWYEMLWPLLLLMTVLAVLLPRLRGEARGDHVRRDALTFWATSVLVPALVLALVRLLTRPTGTYEGTQLTFGQAGVRSGIVGFLGTLPGASWPMSAKVTPFNLRQEPFFAAAAFAGLLAFGIYLFSSRRGEAVARQTRAGSGPLWQWWMPVALVAYFWLTSIGTVMFTVKYSAEVKDLGQTYLYYAPALLGSGILVYGAALWLRDRGVRPGVATIALAVAPVLVTLQFAVNWSLLGVQRAELTPVSHVVQLAASGGPHDERCAAANALLSAQIPGYGYPVKEMLFSADKLYVRRTGEGFC
ncbi:MAG: hypothetical protein QOI54_1166 [Actinomycetota bacterium]|nr:hypothetical protein [Actinomycetota bacterium]